MKEKEIKEKIIEILEKIDDIHTDGYLMRDYQDKLAAQILAICEQYYEKTKTKRNNEKNLE